MTEIGVATTIGGRIQALRRARGMRTSKELADAVGGTMTVSIIENIELGRKSNLDAGQLLSIAMALQVPPSYVLAPLNDPNAPLDLPGLSPAFDGMTAIEFDAWLAGLDQGSYRPTTLDARNSISELNALREWAEVHAEVVRLELMVQLQQEAGENNQYTELARERLQDARRAIQRLAPMLKAGGWDLPSDERPDEEAIA